MLNGITVTARQKYNEQTRDNVIIAVNKDDDQK